MTRRNVRAGVDDLWTKTVRDPDGTTRTVPSAEHGRGMRWRARYVDDSGREHTKAFTRKADAQAWLDTEITPKLAAGTYVAPEAGRVTVAAVYESWSASQGTSPPRRQRPARAHGIAASNRTGVTWRWSTSRRRP